MIALAMFMFLGAYHLKEQVQQQEVEITTPPKDKVASETPTIVYIEVPVIKEIEKEEPPSLYDTLTQEEITLIELTVQHEVGNFTQRYRELVAGIIRNRLESPDFPNTITEVLYSPGQFTDGDYNGVIVDDITRAAVKNVFDAETPFHDATFYYNPALSAESSIIWFEYSGDIEYIFSYSEDNWGITYTTRFFK